MSRYFALVLMACAHALGQTPPAPQNATFAQRMKQTVAFIQLTCKNGDKTEVRAGTGFFAQYPDERLGKGAGFTYLVTNRHLALCWDDRRKAMIVESISARVNLVDGSSRVLENQGHGNLPWVLPTDDSVDLAAVAIGLDQKVFEYLPIGLNEFATDEVLVKQQVSEGSRIIFSGFFQQYPGLLRIQPIIREGIVAMMPNESFPTTTGRLGKVFLGDIHTFLGNSGSPVFVDLAGVRNGGIIVGEDYKLFGVISGYFYEDEELSLQVTTTMHGRGKANSGVALIVPASAVKNLLEDPHLQADRDSNVAAL